MGEIRIIIICALSFFYILGNSQCLETRITVQFEDEPILSILKQIEKKYKINFSINSSLIPDTQKVTVELEDVTVAEALEVILQNLNISYKEINKQIVLYKRKSPTPNYPPNANSNQNRNDKHRQVIYDTIIKLTYDTITTHNFDTLIVVDTLYTFDTVEVIRFIEPTSKVYLNVFYSPTFYTETRLLSNSNNLQINNYAFEKVFSSYFGADIGMRHKRNGAEIGIGILEEKEKVAYSFTEFELKTFKDSVVQTEYEEVIKEKNIYYETNGTDTIWRIVNDTSYVPYETVSYFNTDSTFENIKANEYKQQLTYITLPFRYSFTFINRKKVKVSVLAGGMYSYLLQNEIIDKTTDDTAVLYSRQKLAVHTGLKLEAKPRENIAFYVMPIYHMQTNFLHTSEIIIPQKLSVNTNFGLTYYF